MKTETRTKIYNVLPLITILLLVVSSIQMFWIHETSVQKALLLQAQNEMLLKVLDNQNKIMSSDCNE